MNDTSKQEELMAVKKHVRQHVIIAVGLAIGSITTLWSSQTNFGNFSLNVGITLTIAAVQAFFVAAFFMHLLSEKRMIYCFLVFTAIFFVVMIGVTFWARLPENIVHYQM